MARVTPQYVSEQMPLDHGKCVQLHYINENDFEYLEKIKEV